MISPKERVEGFPLHYFVCKQMKALSLVEAWLGFSYGDQVIPTNDALRESGASVGIGWLLDDAGMHVGKCLHCETSWLSALHISRLSDAAVKSKEQTL